MGLVYGTLVGLALLVAFVVGGVLVVGDLIQYFKRRKVLEGSPFAVFEVMSDTESRRVVKCDDEETAMEFLRLLEEKGRDGFVVSLDGRLTDTG